MVFILPQLEKKPSLKSQFSSAFSRGLNYGVENSLKREKQGLTPEEQEQFSQALQSQGVPEHEADDFVRTFSTLNQGAKTAAYKDLLEKRNRKGFYENFGQEDRDESDTQPLNRSLQQSPNATSMEGERRHQAPNEGSDVASETLGTPGEEAGDNAEFEEPFPQKKYKDVHPKAHKQKVMDELYRHLQEKDRGATPNQIVARENKRYEKGTSKYEEASKQLKGAAKTNDLILENLNKSDKLPKNLGRLNVKTDGTLLIPYASSAETQRFIKTLNEFSAGAKDTYGAQVTNFDLQQFMLRYPTLLNTKEGREHVLQQMKIVNDLNAVYYKNLKNVYDSAGGSRYIDSDRADYFATKLSEPHVEKLREKFDKIGSFESLPSPSWAKGRKIRDKTTGEILISDGQNWLPFNSKEEA
jgi:hypothetical protein